MSVSLSHNEAVNYSSLSSLHWREESESVDLTLGHWHMKPDSHVSAPKSPDLRGGVRWNRTRLLGWPHRGSWGCSGRQPQLLPINCSVEWKTKAPQLSRLMFGRVLCNSCRSIRRYLSMKALIQQRWMNLIWNYCGGKSHLYLAQRRSTT
jgi:hypothetical protein